MVSLETVAPGSGVRSGAESFPVASPFGRQQQDDLVDARQPSLPLAARSPARTCRPGPGHLRSAPTRSRCDHRLRPGAVAGVPPSRPRPGRVGLLVPEVLGGLRLQRGLQRRVGQSGQQTLRGEGSAQTAVITSRSDSPWLRSIPVRMVPSRHAELSVCRNQDHCTVVPTLPGSCARPCRHVRRSAALRQTRRLRVTSRRNRRPQAGLHRCTLRMRRRQRTWLGQSDRS